MLIFDEYSDLLTNQGEIRRSMQSAASYICYVLKRFIIEGLETFLSWLLVIWKVYVVALEIKGMIMFYRQ